ncbi:hypothetical protein TGPRC2_306010 [Toxoplasma gondii TgCatPRC2]|uniref:Uncharacterized protein n=4 Tax=Toxoplasma gondii TaxID=5811 RepID=B6KRA0_TOXGV|nr:hypothetical protein TGME49_306010 [Toxoplasma gondii ME49]ESS28989.1 hypothetical protein TGVEG_306010 [Toxoplasma gondii VEG]KYF44726.1 hypothetical protein TGARI_306010 [Toxoplasma gondii ARI]KYK64628.1 hypothetical protein TGPRC2_306010 [Toxoplasma gondii TgCatPRC2]EPT27432.1 hypothetical protein TGME49_306010 [Toxoplasma gondii ME49]CEL76249.1 TPA: hypothetical protein BN1205_107460 [Toxoplasma gondii VEG]|eukprot:XP_002370373.1 hypothetical protein TGME49_306010 [Toxoplasma gondii ME49]
MCSKVLLCCQASTKAAPSPQHRSAAFPTNTIRTLKKPSGHHVNRTSVQQSHNRVNNATRIVSLGWRLAISELPEHVIQAEPDVWTLASKQASVYNLPCRSGVYRSSKCVKLSQASMLWYAEEGSSVCCESVRDSRWPLALGAVRCFTLLPSVPPASSELVKRRGGRQGIQPLPFRVFLFGFFSCYERLPRSLFSSFKNLPVVFREKLPPTAACICHSDLRNVVAVFFAN